MAPPPTIFPGQRFARLIVLDEVPERRPKHYACQCDCGNVKVVQGNNLRSGSTRSCGCLMRETNGGRPTHGMTDTPTWHAWRGAVQRCSDTNPNSRHWKYYGQRGISVCERWRGRDGFVNFLADMGERPEDMSLDRVDNDGNYEPGNCRWATAQEQNTNRRPWRSV